MGKSREGPGAARRAGTLAVEHKWAVFHLDHTLLTYSLYWCSQDSALGILSVWMVERDDSTDVRKLGFSGQWNGSGNVSSGGESVLFPARGAHFPGVFLCVNFQGQCPFSTDSLLPWRQSAALSNEESELQAP